MLQLNENPAALLPGLDRPSDAAGDWFVAHTKPRTEKKLAWDLMTRSVPYFLPLARRTRVWGGRRRTVLTPLFPSYVFFCGDGETRLGVFHTDRACQVIPVQDRAKFVKELDAVHAALEVDCELDVYPHAVVGRRCRVCRGPMRGVEGVVVQSADVTRIVLQVSIIGRGASLQISASDLEEAE